MCTAVCGDGLLSGDESCDDGDGCDDRSASEPGFACGTGGKGRVAVCSDGQRRGSEQCDDSNAVAGGGCWP